MTLTDIPSFRLDHKKALIMGASSGIGCACALALAAYGAQVWIGARRLDRLTETAEHIQSHGGIAHPFYVDVSDIPQTQSILHQHGPFDILINSIGVARHSPALNTTPEDFDWVNHMNYKAAYFITTTVANDLIATNQTGSLINISSQMGHVGGVDRAVYAASKHALEGMTKSMAIEWGSHGIRVNTICPTFIRTELTATTFEQPDKIQWIEEKIQLGRVGEVSDITGAAVFLASNASSLITGTSILIDGGWTAA